MTRTVRLALSLMVLAVLLAWTPHGHAEPFGAGASFDQPGVALVATAALAFMQPRILDPVPAHTLGLWGLQGLTTLDPQLLALSDGQVMRLFVQAPDGRQQVWARAMPAETPRDTAAWGELIADGLHGGWNASATVRRIGTQGMVRAMFDEVFSHLDPYSRYADPAEAERARSQRDGDGDVGLRLDAHRTGLVVTGVEPGGPAARAGIRPGERILAVNDVPVSATADGLPVAGLLSGPDGSAVTLDLRGARPLRRITLIRTVRVPETVFARRRGGALLVRITGFAHNTGARLADELSRYARTRPRGVVLDLRGNRGGLLDQAVAAAAALMDEGPVARTAGRDPSSVRTLSVVGGRDFAAGLPVVVLIDGRTASAAEVLAASLSDDRRAVTVGSATFGKGLVQTIAPLPDGGELYVSWAQLVAPGGWPLQDLGVLPHVCTSPPEPGTLPARTAGLQRHDAARLPLPLGEVLDIRATCPPAEGRDADLTAAFHLIDDADAYAAALARPRAVTRP